MNSTTPEITWKYIVREHRKIDVFEVQNFVTYLRVTGFINL